MNELKRVAAPTEIDQSKDKMLEILEGKGLSFLFPLMKLEKELLKQIKVDPSPQSIYKWIKENISPKLHTDKGFVNILMTRYGGGARCLMMTDIVFAPFDTGCLSVSCSTFLTRSTPTTTRSSSRRPARRSWRTRNSCCCRSSR